MYDEAFFTITNNNKYLKVYFLFQRIMSSLKEVTPELLAERNLKPTEVNEKNVLPTAEDLKQEKDHQTFLSGWYQT